LICSFLSTNQINSQISIRENDIVEKAVVKPSVFDSLTNIVLQRNIIDYKKYIGYKLFFLPKSKKYTSDYGTSNKIIDYLFSNDSIEITKEGKLPFDEVVLNQVSYGSKADKIKYSKQYKESLKKYEKIDKEKTNIYKPQFYYERTDKTDGKIYGKIGTSSDSVEGKYFTILDIKGNTNSNRKSEYKKLDDIDLSSESPSLVNLQITLRNESNKDTVYWIGQARNIGTPFFLVPYFEKQRNMYLNQNLVLKSKTSRNSELENLIDVNTGAVINVEYGDVWTCSDISFIDSKDSYYLAGFYFLRNKNRIVKIDLTSNLIHDYFMLESEFKKQELEKLKKEEQRKLEEQERNKREKQEEIKFRNDCIAKWGQNLGSLIADGKVKLGMNKEMCISAWGNPININRTILDGLTWEQWVYGWGTYLYFKNNILSTIQD